MLNASFCERNFASSPCTSPRYLLWMGAGRWNATPAQRKPAIADAVVIARRWAQPCSPSRRRPRPSPRVRVVTFPRLGHMAPVTHPELINAEIAKFLREA
jgi:pimeloyl-ACP methyl ester carboxylesterase